MRAAAASFWRGRRGVLTFVHLLKEDDGNPISHDLELDHYAPSPPSDSGALFCTRITQLRTIAAVASVPRESEAAGRPLYATREALRLEISSLLAVPVLFLAARALA